MSADGGVRQGARPLCLLSRAYCHLCDDMLGALAKLAEGRPVEIRVIDVDAHPGLEARYGEAVPVLMAGDPRDEGAAPLELCHHRIDRAKVLAWLAEMR